MPIDILAIEELLFKRIAFFLEDNFKKGALGTTDDLFGDDALHCAHAHCSSYLPAVTPAIFPTVRAMPSLGSR